MQLDRLLLYPASDFELSAVVYNPTKKGQDKVRTQLLDSGNKH